jgi:hypothetical protein
MHISRRHLSYANVTATLALVFAMSGGRWRRTTTDQLDQSRSVRRCSRSSWVMLDQLVRAALPVKKGRLVKKVA